MIKALRNPSFDTLQEFARADLAVDTMRCLEAARVLVEVRERRDEALATGWLTSEEATGDRQPPLSRFGELWALVVS